jgi:hypothetical protein
LLFVEGLPRFSPCTNKGSSIQQSKGFGGKISSLLEDVSSIIIDNQEGTEKGSMDKKRNNKIIQKSSDI